jgi:hypothetical protein
MVNKESATYYERKALHEFENMPGYIEGRRTPASLGVFDLWIMMKDGLHLVQIKSTKQQLRFEPLKEEIRELQLPSFCIKELWIWYSYKPVRKNKTIENYKGWQKFIL